MIPESIIICQARQLWPHLKSKFESLKCRFSVRPPDQVMIQMICPSVLQRAKKKKKKAAGLDSSAFLWLANRIPGSLCCPYNIDECRFNPLAWLFLVGLRGKHVRTDDRGTRKQVIGALSGGSILNLLLSAAGICLCDSQLSGWVRK